MDQETDALRETKLSGETVYRGRILDLEVDRVRLANGSEATREVVRHRGAAVVLPLRADRRVVLVRQYRYPSEEVLLELPAGKLDPGEDAGTCAARELEEETGLRAANVRELGSFLTTPGFTDEVLHAFLATGLSEVCDASPDPDEAIQIVTMTVEEVLAACRTGGIRDGKTLATIFLAQLNGWISVE